MTDHLILGCRWDYSNTTLRHLSKFVDMYCLDVSSEILSNTSKKAVIKKLIEIGKIELDSKM